MPCPKQTVKQLAVWGPALLLGLLAATNTSAQDSFEGIIHYEISVESKSDRVTKEYLVSAYGTRQSIYFQAGNLRTEYHNSGSYEIFRSSDNKQYAWLAKKQKLEVFDAAEEQRQLASFKVVESDEVILGRPTKLIEIEYEDGSSSKYCFDSSLYINPEPFMHFRFAFQNRYWEVAQAPYLKHVKTNVDSVITYTATKIERRLLDSQLFAVPRSE